MLMKMADFKDFSHNVFLLFFFFFILPFVPGSPVSWRLFWLLLPQLPFPSLSAEGLQELHSATVARRREAQPVKWRLHKFIWVEI